MGRGLTPHIFSPFSLPSLVLNEFAGIPAFYDDFLGNPWESVGNEIKKIYLANVFVTGRVSGNEQLGNILETRGECKWITAAHALLCWCTAASALGHLHSPRVETRRHD